MYDPGPSDEELATWGLKREDVEETVEIEVWAENEKARRVFESLGRAWVHGPNGPVSLDYAVLLQMIDLFGVKKRKQKREMLASIRVMENEALRVIRLSK